MKIDPRRGLAGAATLVVLVGALAACGASSAPAGGSHEGGAQPDAVLSGRVLVVGGPYVKHSRNHTATAPLGATVTAYKVGSGTRGRQRVAETHSSRSDGRFSLRLRPGTYLVVATVPDGSDPMRSQPVTLSAGSSRTVTLRYSAH